MIELGNYRKMVIGKTLTNLFFTNQNGPYDYLPGIAPAYYFSSIMELDRAQKLRFGNDFIVEWKDEEPITILTNDNWGLPKLLVFKGQKIVDLIKDEYGQLTFLLENGTTIAHTIDYGDQLFIENIKINQCHEQPKFQQMTAAISPQSKTGQKWWQKLFSFK